ncbi:MAG: family 43 glycosylhydrolase [Oscillospiraceae bacterium]|nr:family 43 glycosylhydrolase [Oscillospiraceae bacterium]
MSISANSFRLDRIAFMCEAGDSVRLIAMNVGAYSVAWMSSDPDIAAVGDDGVVTALSDGDARITATLIGGGISAECIASVGYNGQNPTVPPSWGLYIADGEPHVFGERFYIYGSRDCPNGYMEGAPKNDWCSGDYHTLWSEDLIHWTDAGISISIEDVPAEMRGQATRLWAPDIFNDPKNGSYHLAFCSNGADVFIADGEQPEGPFANIRKITMGGETIRCIDPGVLVDDDGTVYIALPFEFFIAKLDPDDYSRIIPETKVGLRPIIDQADAEYFPFEGPSLRKRNGLYYYIYISSRKGENIPTRMGTLVASDPMDIGSWRYGGPLIETRDFIRAGNVHGSFEEFGGKYYLSYHRMAQGFDRFTRMMNLDELMFRADGTPIPVVRTSSGARGFFPVGERVYAASACVLSGGREDDRFVRSYAQDKRSPYPYAYLKLSPDAYAGFRYVKTEPNVAAIQLNYRCREAARVMIEMVPRDSLDEQSARRFTVDLPKRSDWSTERCPFISGLDGVFEIRFSLEKSTEPPNAFDFAWFSISC